jgi:ATP-dependent Clp protease ATP-binding subunit ClpA
MHFGVGGTALAATLAASPVKVQVPLRIDESRVMTASALAIVNGNRK